MRWEQFFVTTGSAWYEPAFESLFQTEILTKAIWGCWWWSKLVLRLSWNTSCHGTLHKFPLQAIFGVVYDYALHNNTYHWTENDYIHHVIFRNYLRLM